MIHGILSLYRVSYPRVLAYMLQTTEYQGKDYLVWFWHTADFTKVVKRQTLVKTKAVRILLAVLWLGIGIEILFGAWLIYLGYTGQLIAGVGYGIVVVLAYPIVWAHAIVVPILVGRWCIVLPYQRRLVRQSQGIFHNHTGHTIAVAGSYGKTTMKELLHTVLSEGKKVAATPANKNVAVSHAQFAQTLSNDEDVVIVEFGEGKPKDVERFTRTVRPDTVVITGIAPAHLDAYKTLDAAARDIFSATRGISPDNVYVNGDSEDTAPYMSKGFQQYTEAGVAGWKIRDVSISINGTQFTMYKGARRIHVTSGLLGRHQIGPLAAVAAIADHLGLTKAQIEKGLAKTVPFAHRMQPYRLGHAWVIDDAYNGNLEGMRAGLALLRELPAERRIYVTPGLVDQGAMTASIHHQLGGHIAEAQPDVVVLMKHSVTEHIIAGLEAKGFQGKLNIEDDPLKFYTNLDQFVAAGDVVLLQNDWPDKYA